MKKKLLSLILVVTFTFGMTACGNSTESTDSKRVAELEEQIEELKQQLEEAKQGQTDTPAGDSTTSTGNFDSETQSLVDSINADTAEYQGVCGADAKWYYKDNVLVIKGTGEISDNPWNSENYEKSLSINWAIIDEGITQISCESAFHGSAYYSTTGGLSKIILPSTLTDISPSAFSHTQITSIVLPEGLTKINEDLFDSCDSLNSVVIPNSVTEIGNGAFSRCSSLTEVTLPDSVTTIGGGAFSSCSSLKNVNIPEGVTSIKGDTFFCCTSLTDIILPSHITEIGGFSFYGCHSLVNINIPASVENIGIAAFCSCEALDDSIRQNIEALNPDAFHTVE